MARTDALRQQHEDIGQIVVQMKKIVESGNIAPQAGAIRSALSTLGGKLSVHLAMEDKVLYPHMLGCSNPQAHSMAEAFQKEMGGLAGAFKDFSTKWSEGAISGNPTGFATEAGSLIKVLIDRVQRENTQLYPLADQV